MGGGMSICIKLIYKVGAMRLYRKVEARRHQIRQFPCRGYADSIIERLAIIPLKQYYYYAQNSLQLTLLQQPKS